MAGSRDDSRSVGYGRLVGRLYDYFFGKAYTRKRLKIREALAAFAEKNQGVIHHDNYTELFPKVNFSGRNHKARLVLTPTYEGLNAFDLSAVFTAQHDDVDRFPFPVIQIFSSNLLRRVFSNKWMKKRQTGDATFDHWFVCRTLDPFPVGEFLGDAGKRMLFSLRYLFERNNLYLSCQADKVLIRKSVNDDLLCDPETYRSLWRMARVLFRRLDNNLRMRFGPGHRGWIVMDELKEGTVPECLVCGEPIFFNCVYCARCDTPHHLDCWEYNGRCSVYACECADYSQHRR